MGLFKHPVFSNFYVEKLPLQMVASLFEMDQKKIKQSKRIGQFLGIIFISGFIGYTLLINFGPPGITVEYASGNDTTNISELGPENRVQKETIKGQTMYRQTHDLIYFTTKMPFQFDNATVHMLFQNVNPDQIISVGFQDQDSWHYNTQLVDVPFFNSLRWAKSGINPVLFQRQKKFSSVKSFLLNIPSSSIIGTFNYDTNFGKTSSSRLPDYKPSNKKTIIDSPLRGKQVMYAYLEHEPFQMTIQKQDLNWYEDPDPVNITIYKGNTIIYQTTMKDDGSHSNSKKSLPPQETTIDSLGSGFPESGVYKIIIDANADTLITRIATNLHKIVFQGPIFLAGNNEVYPSIVSKTSATTLFTNALTLSAITYHNPGLQKINVGNQILDVNILKLNETIVPQKDFTQVIVPKNDVVLNGYLGFFAFNSNQFFVPIPYRVIPVTTKADTDLVDYILTDYNPPQQEGQWQMAEKTFNLHSAFIKDGNLSWVIEAPKLQENGNEVLIKNLDITFHKNSWF